MRKQFKKALSMVLSAAMVLTLGSGLELQSAKAADKTCSVAFYDSESKLSLDLGTINGDGTYTLKYEGEFYANEKNTALYLQFGDDKGVGVEDAKSPAVKDVTVKADGKNVEFTKAPAITKDGKKVQIQFYNAWGGEPWDGSNPATVLKDGKTALDCEKSLEFTFTLEGFWDAPEVPVETPAPTTSGGGADETPAPTSSGSATQPPAPVDPVDEEFETGIVVTAQDYGINNVGPEDVTGAEAAGVKLYDTKVSGKGQYQVATDLRAALGAAGLQFTALYIMGAEKYFPDYVIRLDEMKINGENVPEETLKKAYTCSDDKIITRVNLYNGWCPEDDASKDDHRPDARSLEDLKNCTPYMLEEYCDEEIMTMEIAFTYGPKDYVLGQEKNSIAESLIPEEPELGEKETPAPPTNSPDPSGQETPKPNQPTQNPGGTTPGQPTKAPTTPTQAPAAGLTNGTTAKVGGATYKVTDAKAGAVEFSAPKKNATSVTIPATVKVNGKSCKVTSIKAKAFSGNKKLKSVVIGKNIKTIGNQAFFKCSKLKKVTFKGTAVKKIGKKAFAKTNKKMTVTVPKKLKKKALNSYKKLMKKAGVSKKAKYKKK